MRTLIILAMVLSTAASAADHAITVYSRAAPGAIDPRVFEAQISNPDYRQNVPGYAIVRTRADLELDRGTGAVRFEDVAAGMDPTTVAFESRTDPENTHVLEQSFRYDLVSTERILDRYLGRTISVDQVIGSKVETIRGELLAARGGDLILRRADGGLVSIGATDRNIRFPDLPDGLIVRPTLEWLVSASRGGTHAVQVTYETLGMTWWTDYNVVHSEDDGCRMDLSAWVSLVNQSGASFPDSTLKLIAGDVHRAPQPQQRRYMRTAVAQAEEVAAGGFTEKGFFEYHLYTLGRPVDLPDRSLKQLELFPPVLGIACQKKLLFDSGIHPRFGGVNPYTNPQYPGGQQGDIDVFLSFVNDEDEGLGIPLPRGRVRVHLEDPADQSLEFIGEDTIDHTPRNETVELQIGQAFDVVGERRQADFRWSKSDQWAAETMEVALRNQKDESVRVEVRESLYRWTNWEIRNPSHDYRKLDGAHVAFDVEVPPEEETVIRYTAYYSW